MPEILDSIHYSTDEMALASRVDVSCKYHTREYIVSLFDCGRLEARIIFANLEDAQDRALEHLSKDYEDAETVFLPGKLYIDSEDFDLVSDPAK